MKIIQVDEDYVRDNLNIKGLANDTLYRLCLCDDGNHGRSHKTLRLKPVKNLSVAELTESLEASNYAFILVEED